MFCSFCYLFYVLAGSNQLLTNGHHLTHPTSQTQHSRSVHVGRDRCSSVSGPDQSAPMGTTFSEAAPFHSVRTRTSKIHWQFKVIESASHLIELCKSDHAPHLQVGINWPIRRIRLKVKLASWNLIRDWPFRKLEEQPHPPTSWQKWNSIEIHDPHGTVDSHDFNNYIFIQKFLRVKKNGNVCVTDPRRFDFLCGFNVYGVKVGCGRPS